MLRCLAPSASGVPMHDHLRHLKIHPCPLDRRVRSQQVNLTQLVPVAHKYPTIPPKKRGGWAGVFSFCLLG